jgi:hypothetical protein
MIEHCFIVAVQALWHNGLKNATSRDRRIAAIAANEVGAILHIQSPWEKL